MLDVSKISEWQTSALPPVHLWSPPFCGDMDLIIKANGDWIHEGSKIKREKMVTLFSRILWFENNEYFLVTPSEKVRIQVEDAPFLITQWRFLESEWCESEQGHIIEFTSLTHDVVQLGVDCDIWMAPAPSNTAQKKGASQNTSSEERPYLSMRYGMKAMLHRNVFYDLTKYLEPVSNEQGEGLGLVSAGKSYLLIDEASLNCDE
ncbi:hypothetical protein MSP8886_01880 [Marinomonas spartinae]|uniref:DUF1285 domain-containing protein n=1 Tax=Marinomonas spartinae TaxID=1792290 RepID=A0A1A8TC97_9GAMM|nr:DUF1285 domain-containing protein [Marinomonas spartinae]SBS30649.1 hypothetical protein MSP8886_01880 [Marinomonas spartinae]